jgi:16S rRNA (guanine527-N7)-methyltransferase
LGGAAQGLGVPARAALARVLGEAQRRGFLGPGPVEAHVAQAEALAELLAPSPERFLDLGSGGGVPGLVLALTWPGAEAALLEANRRRATFLRTAVAELGLTDRAMVVAARAEDAARDPRHRARYPLVVARAFGPPAVTAECATGFLAAGGTLAVTEPPEDDPTRWPAEALTELGFTSAEFRRNEATGAALLRHPAAPDARWPRRDGLPTKGPLW